MYIFKVCFIVVFIIMLQLFFITLQYHAETIANVRHAVGSFNDTRMIGIALDTKGPEIRTGVLAAV